MSAAMGTRATDRRAIKIMRLHGAAINHLSCLGDLVVTGGADGLVRFYDSMLRMSAWFEDLGAGPVSCVSFATKGQARPWAKMQMQRFVAPSFIVSTTSGKLLAVSSESFNDPDPDFLSGAELLLESPTACISDISAHPLRPDLVMLDARQSRLLRWDLVKHVCQASRQLPPKYKASKVMLSRDGSFLVLGGGAGHVVVLKGDSLEDVVVLKNTKHPIVR
eukprot:GHRR01033547.1.p1 GENE.GHRR01033547.1~~GHRR01033547.1.p1  ORF type:complete len:243 (+),score=80.19 GHRR01033547.1:71-730(+)